MFSAKTRPLDHRRRNHPAEPKTADQPSASSNLIRRSVSNPSPGIAVEDIMEGMEACKLKEEAEPLASACQRALVVLGSPGRAAARARKLALLDQFYKKGPASGRASLDLVLPVKSDK